jgi:STE24 endopeptidase
MSLRVKACVLMFSLCLTAAMVFAQPAPTMKTEMPTVITVPDAAKASPNFSAEAATDAYIAEMPAAARERSDKYFEGGYWLILWDFLYGVAVALIILNFRWSAKMRDLAERITRFKSLQTLFYWLQYLVVASVLSLPLAIYEGYFREHQYGLATQTFGPWMIDQFKNLLVNAVLGGILFILLFAVVRRVPRTWWIWGSAVMTVFLVFVILIVPVFIIPIFNKVTKLEDPRVTQPILALARANGIPAHDVYQVDASKQTTRMSANVSGFGNTMRITLNDNLLRRGSPEEIQAVMGHEMGHYVLNHVYKSIVFFFLMIVAMFAFTKWALDWSLARWGERWQIRGIGDPAILPLAILVISVFGFITTPIMNSFTRIQEYEADMYGINASRQADGFAQAAIHLGEYRKMSPGHWEEILFYDHPSGRSRIYAAMRWKAENQTTQPFNAAH